MGQAIKNNSEAIKQLREANDHQTKTMEAMQRTQQQMLTTVTNTARFIEDVIKPTVQTPEDSRGAQP